MLKYDRIMIATDFSRVSEIAAREAIELARHYKSELVFLHVVEHFPEHLPHYHIAHDDMDPQEFIVNKAEQDLAALCQRLGSPDATREVRLTTRSAKVEIVHFAIDQKIALIVIGSRGRHSLLDVLSGSTATGVVRAAPCDVFVIHDPDEQSASST